MCAFKRAILNDCLVCYILVTELLYVTDLVYDCHRLILVTDLSNVAVATLFVADLSILNISYNSPQRVNYIFVCVCVCHLFLNMLKQPLSQSDLLHEITKVHQ